MDKNMTEEVISYKCNWCGKLYKSELEAFQCAFEHARENYANALLVRGHNLSYIKYACGFDWKLTTEQEQITKDNCFIISHWQCCEKPAYQITYIYENGVLELRGKGSWSGYYGNKVRINGLPKPHPKEDLFIDPR